MTWTPERLGQIPEVYRDFMTVLRPILETRDPRAVLKIEGIPFGTIYSALTTRYDYDADQVRELADNLKRGGYIEEDQFGFFTPTSKGEDLIRAVTGGEVLTQQVPPLPAF